MQPSVPPCIVCERTENEVPLLLMRYMGKDYSICPQHLPILIHKPQQLEDRLPGAANLSAHSHED
ncbi:MAG: hypothetical protein MUE67_00095 [Anaerolineales bacterium]|nr:hypothetical protein [Anaerolineales bacterium]